MLDRFPKPLIIAHRGDSAHCPENTLASFLSAVTQGADGIELDTKLSADHQVMVIHDQTVDRTTDGYGRVGHLSFDKLRKLDAGSRYASLFKGERIPTLAEVFDCVGKKTLIDIELTNYRSPWDELPTLVAELIKQYDLAASVMITSFFPSNLVRFNRLLPDVPVGFLVWPGKAGRLMLSLFGPMTPHTILVPNRQLVTPTLIQYYHRKQCGIIAWTVNQPEEMQRLIDLGVNGLITDNPQLARKIIGGAV